MTTDDASPITPEQQQKRDRLLNYLKGGCINRDHAENLLLAFIDDREILHAWMEAEKLYWRR